MTVCKYRGCHKQQQTRYDGYCIVHHKVLQSRSAQHGGGSYSYKCNYKGCTKNKQSQRGGYCIAHWRVVNGLPPGKPGNPGLRRMNKMRKLAAVTAPIVPDIPFSAIPVVSSSSNSSASSTAQNNRSGGGGVGGHKKKRSRSTIDSTDTSVVSKAASSSNTAKSAKVEKKWTCPKCRGDVREPPPSKPAENNNESSSSGDELAKSNSTIVTCALKSCSAPRYHLQCTGIPVCCDVYNNAIISNNTDERGLADCLTNNNNNQMPWWYQVSDTASYFANKHKPLQRDWPLQRESFICPNCDVEGTSRYLLEYFEKFHAMKKNFYAEYLGGSNKPGGRGDRLARADESVESRTGESFLWHLLKDNCRDREIKKWNASEIKLGCMSRALGYLSKELQRQRKEEHHRRDQRQKNKFKLDPSYLVGMPIRLFNPIENSYHSGRIIDFKLNAPYEMDQALSETKPSTSDASFPEPDMKNLVDERIITTIYLVRFRHGTEGRKTSVHQWIYLEEHAVTVGGEICWAKVEDGDNNIMSDNESSGVKSMDRESKMVDKQFKSIYRPVQISFRSLLEMLPVEELGTAEVLASGLGRFVTTIRLTLEHNSQSSNCFPFTPTVPSWLDEILNRARLSDEDVALGVALACMEKEEERRVRSWRNLSISHISPQSK